MIATDGREGSVLDHRREYYPPPVDIGAVAREYVLLALRCDRLMGGLVEAYTGAEALRRRVAVEPRPRVDQLARDAARLRAELAGAEPVGVRCDFLERQLVAVESMLRRESGVPLGYRAEVRAYFDTEIELGEPDRYREAHAELAELLPGGGPLAARMSAYRKLEELPAERIGPAVQALSAALRELVRRWIELPAGESVYYEVATDRPWSAFNHYLGGYRSRVLVNADTSRRASQLAHLVAHEAYPGHHTERCRRQVVLVDRTGCLEHAVFLLNTPQCLVSEGLADLGLLAAVGPAWGRWAAGVLAERGVRLDGELAERVERAMLALLAVRQDAALLLHDRGVGANEVVDYLRRWLLVPERRARQMLRFLATPRWRAYTTTYVEGYRLLRAWLEARPPAQPAMHRLARLLDEPLTPTALRAELTGRPATSR
jgi:hypothetical protein